MSLAAGKPSPKIKFQMPALQLSDTETSNVQSFLLNSLRYKSDLFNKFSTPSLNLFADDCLLLFIVLKAILEFAITPFHAKN